MGNCDGFVGNRMLGPYGAEVRQMVEEGNRGRFFYLVLSVLLQVATWRSLMLLPLTSVWPWVLSLCRTSLAKICSGGLGMARRAEDSYLAVVRKMAGDMKMETAVAIGPHDLTDWLCEKGRFGQKAGKGKRTCPLVGWLYSSLFRCLRLWQGKRGQED